MKVRLELKPEEREKILTLRMLEQTPEKQRSGAQDMRAYELNQWLIEESPKILQRLAGDYHAFCHLLAMDEDRLEIWETEAPKFVVPEIPDRLTDSMFQKLENKISMLTSLAYNTYEESSDWLAKMLAYRTRYRQLCKAVIGSKSEWYAEAILEIPITHDTSRLIADVHAVVSRYELILKKLDAAQKILSRRVTALLSQVEAERSFGGRRGKFDDSSQDSSNIHELDDDDIEDATATAEVKDDLGRRRKKQNGKGC